LATLDQQQELLDILRAQPRQFKIELFGYGGELVAGAITAEQHDFFRTGGTGDLDSLIYEEEYDCPDSMKFIQDGEWYNCDDIYHTQGAEFCESSWIAVYDDQGNEVWTCELDPHSLQEKGISEQNIILADTYPQHLPGVTHYYQGTSWEKGVFYSGEFLVLGKFFPSKLQIHCTDYDGITLVDSLTYDSEYIENIDANTNSKSTEHSVREVDND